MKKRKMLLNRLLVGTMSVAMIGSVPTLAAFAADETPTTQTATDQNATQTTGTSMANTTIGGITYYYVNTEGKDDSENYIFTVAGRHGSADTNYSFKKSELTQLGTTSYYYTTLKETPLSGTLYGYVKGSGTPTNYRTFYSSIGVTADANDSNYDAVTSATHYTSHHASDIPDVVTYGQDTEGNKAITGLNLQRTPKTVDAAAYVEASIRQAAGETLTADQQEVLNIDLKADPTKAPSTGEVAVKASNAALDTSKYGAPEFAITLDDTVAGYDWSNYWNSVYAATVSDGTTTVPVVHWIDLYGEKTTNTSSPHYNKIELELNNGKVGEKNDNQATVNRFAAFYDANGNLKAGTYTVTVYADGYSALTATVSVPESTTPDTPDTPDTPVTPDTPDTPDTPVTPAEKKAQKITVSTKNKNIKASALKKKAQTFTIKATTSGDGKITFKKVSKNSNFTVSKTGKVIVKKGLKKKTYKLKVKATASATSSYKKAVKNATITVKVK